MPSSCLNLETIRCECLKTINSYRKRHSLEPLVYEDELEAPAASWSEVLARISKTTSSKYSGIYYGENVAVKRRAVDNLTGWEIGTMWYGEGFNYCYNVDDSMEFSSNFTQLIWASTREFALGITISKEGNAYIVGHFRPSGNINGLFQFNVFPQCEILRPLKSTLEEMNIIGLDEINQCRERHGAPPLSLFHDLIASAQTWAEAIAPLKGTISYSKKCSVGESIAYKFDPLDVLCSRKVLEVWYTYGREYDYSYCSNDVFTDLFTQIIWRSTTDVGFGRATCDGHNYLVVHYRPPGNLSNFDENVTNVINDHL